MDNKIEAFGRPNDCKKFKAFVTFDNYIKNYYILDLSQLKNISILYKKNSILIHTNFHILKKDHIDFIEKVVFNHYKVSEFIKKNSDYFCRPF